MLRGRLQSAQRMIDYFRRQRLQFCTSLAQHPFGQRRAGSDRRRAAANLETRFDNLSVFEECGQAQEVPAGRIGHVHGDRRRRKLADVAGIPEMFQQEIGMHVYLRL